MIHYVVFIRLYDNAQKFDTSFSKSIHKTHFKNFFSKTNENENWKTQILQHNIRRHNMIVMNDVQTWLKIKKNFVSKNRWKIELIITNRNSMILSNRFVVIDEKLLNNLNFFDREWYKTKNIADDEKFECLKFIDVLIVFIKEKRKTEIKQMHNEFVFDSSKNDADVKERNSLWVKDYVVDIHNFLQYWKKKKKTLQI